MIGNSPPQICGDASDFTIWKSSAANDLDMPHGVVDVAALGVTGLQLHKPAVLNAIVTSGLRCRPLRERTLPFLISNQRAVPSSRAKICATRSRSLRRAAKVRARLP
jgi:hypothetical protein